MQKTSKTKIALASITTWWNTKMNIKEICEKYGYTQTALAKEFGIPLRTVQNWYAGVRKPPEYVPNLIIRILEKES